jgi:hypothetical protein
MTVNIGEIKASLGQDVDLVAQPPVSKVVEALDEIGVGHIIETLQGLGGATLDGAHSDFRAVVGKVNDNLGSGLISFEECVGDSPGSAEAREAVITYDRTLTTAILGLSDMALQVRALGEAIAEAEAAATTLQDMITQRRTLFAEAGDAQVRAVDTMQKYVDGL